MRSPGGNSQLPRSESQIFDMAVPFEVKESDDAIKARMAELIAEDAPNYFAVITVDRV